MPKRKGKDAIVASLEKQMKMMQQQLNAFQQKKDESSSEESEAESEISEEGGPKIDLMAINQGKDNFIGFLHDRTTAR